MIGPIDSQNYCDVDFELSDSEVEGNESELYENISDDVSVNNKLGDDYKSLIWVDLNNH